MHILHIHDRLSARGGADIHLLAVAAWQARRQRVSLAVGRVDPDQEPPPGVTLHRVSGLGGRERQAQGAATRVRALCARLKPDLVHLHNALQPAVMRTAAALAPSVVTVQDHRTFCPGPGRVLPGGTPCSLHPTTEACAPCLEDPAYGAMITSLTRQRARALQGFNVVVVLSNYMADELTAAGIPAPRVKVVPPFPWTPDPAVEPPPTTPPGPIALAMGRLVQAKGFHLLLDAWARVRPGLPLLVVGEGTARAELEAQAALLGPGSSSHFTGWLSRPEVEGLLGRAQVAIMPSLWAEPFGIAGLEAQARGVPVVAFRVGGVDDWLRPDHGWPVPPADVAALAQALAQAADPGEARRRGQLAARWTAAHFDPPSLMARLDMCYAQALANGPPGR